MTAKKCAYCSNTGHTQYKCPTRLNHRTNIIDEVYDLYCMQYPHFRKAFLDSKPTKDATSMDGKILYLEEDFDFNKKLINHYYIPIVTHVFDTEAINNVELNNLSSDCKVKCFGKYKTDTDKIKDMINVCNTHKILYEGKVLLESKYNTVFDEKLAYTHDAAISYSYPFYKNQMQFKTLANQIKNSTEDLYRHYKESPAIPYDDMVCLAGEKDNNVIATGSYIQDSEIPVSPVSKSDFETLIGI